MALPSLLGFHIAYGPLTPKCGYLAWPLSRTQDPLNPIASRILLHKDLIRQPPNGCGQHSHLLSLHPLSSLTYPQHFCAPSCSSKRARRYPSTVSFPCPDIQYISKPCQLSLHETPPICLPLPSAWSRPLSPCLGHSLSSLIFCLYVAHTQFSTSQARNQSITPMSQPSDGFPWHLE